MKKSKVLLIFLAIIAIFSFTGCDEDSIDSEGDTIGTDIEDTDIEDIEGTTPTEEQETSETPDSTVYKIGESVTSGNLVFTINNVREANEADITYPPQDGNIYYIVNVTVENKGEATEQLSTLGMFQLTDSAGDEIGEQLVSVTGGEALVTGDLAAGAINSGDISYEMPATASELKMLVGSDIFNGDPFTFELDR